MSTTSKPKSLGITPGTNIRWDQSYGIGREYHWCLVSDESEVEGKCIDPCTVLFTSCGQDMGGRPMNEHPDLALYAEAHNTYNSCQMLPSEMLEKLKYALRVFDDISTNYDCDKDGHKYGTGCRACAAAVAISTINLPKP